MVKTGNSVIRGRICMSKIVELMKSNPNWRETISGMGIRIKENGDLAIFNYGIECDFSNPIVCEARGIIINTRTFDVVCRGFDKFFNSHEQYADTIDWNNCRVEEKIDGSIIKAYFFNGEWRWATNSCINANDASITNSDRSYLDVIHSTINYDDWIGFENKDSNFTYIFELVSPETQVVIKYPFAMLYHIGTRNNITGKETSANIGITQPRIFNINTIDDCIEAVKHLNDESENVEYEGFVVVDKDWHRVKIKSPAYLELHHTWNNGNISKENIIKILKNRDDNAIYIEDVCREFPRIATQIMYYKYRMIELECNIQQYIDYVRGLYEEYDHDRKAVALTIKNQRFAPFGFEAIKSNFNKSASDLLNIMAISRYCKWIEDYIPSDIFK